MAHFLLMVWLGVMSAAVQAADKDEIKLPPGVKLPPQPREWLAPRVDMKPPAKARWGTGWERGRSLPLPLAGHNAVGLRPYVYVLGGVSGRDELGQRSVWMSKAGKDGKLGRWRKTKPPPRPVAFAQTVLAGGRIYLLGGSSRLSIQNLYNMVSSAAIRGNGGLSAWREEKPLPTGVVYHAATACGGYLYVLGGFNGREYLKTLSYAKINPDGTLGEWREAKAPYPHRVGRTFLTHVGSDLLAIGGLWLDTQGEHISSLIMRGKRASDGDVTEWVDEGGLKIASRSLRYSLAEHAGCQGDHFVYVFGGRDPDSLGVSTSQASWINPVEGQLTGWQFGPKLPLYGVLSVMPQNARLYQTASAIVGNTLYVLGGFLYTRELTPEVWVQSLKPYQEPYWLKTKKKS